MNAPDKLQADKAKMYRVLCLIWVVIPGVIFGTVAICLGLWIAVYWGAVMLTTVECKENPDLNGAFIYPNSLPSTDNSTDEITNDDIEIYITEDSPEVVKNFYLKLNDCTEDDNGINCKLNHPQYEHLEYQITIDNQNQQTEIKIVILWSCPIYF